MSSSAIRNSENIFRKDIDYLLDGIENASREGGLTLEDIRTKRHTFDGGGASPRPDQIDRMKRLGMMATLFNGNLDGGASRIAKTFGVEYSNWVVPRMSMTVICSCYAPAFWAPNITHSRHSQKKISIPVPLSALARRYV